MIIQDVRNILMVSRWGSINKAAEQIPMTQPALSRCIQKVEREFRVSLFHRKQGSLIALTKEGEAFVRMGEKMLEAYGEFEQTLERGEDRHTIRLGLPPQMSYSTSELILREMYERCPQCRLYLHPLQNELLKAGLEDGSLDCAVLREVGREKVEERFHFVPLTQNSIMLALRKGSRAGEKAREVPGQPWKVLSLEHLWGEKFVANLPGSNSRKYSECVLEKAGISGELIPMANLNNRMDMVRRGEANCLVLAGLATLPQYAGLDFFALPPEQTVIVMTGIACRKGQEKKRYFKLLCECMKEVYL